MDIITKIVTVIGGIIGILAAMGILTGVKNLRSGMANDESRMVDKGIEQIVVGGVIAFIVTGVVAYVIVKINAITF
ncbi:TPA: type III secretion system protein PrgF [Enterococcus faecalis]|nr:type III secretion system protein PrgF [Enterococcus faecalis]